MAIQSTHDSGKVTAPPTAGSAPKGWWATVMFASGAATFAVFKFLFIVLHSAHVTGWLIRAACQHFGYCK